MKRGRTEELQFGQSRPQQHPPGPQRIITTTTQPHNAATASTGSTIQYQITPNIIKTSAPPDSVASITSLGSAQQQQQPQLAPQQTTNVQYTASYNASIGGGNLIKSQQASVAPQSQQQHIHVVNSTNQTRITPTLKGTVVNASPSPSTTPNSGTPSSTGGSSQSITSMSPGVLPGGGGGAVQQPSSQGHPPSAPQGQAQLQRLKVEDALSYLDQVKYRFGNQPQVYNDFLDIMKEFKSQSIDTPGVIQRVSNLFKGHPELIVGFNTFLPPGYKIEVQANDQGYAFQVSVSVPSTSTGTSVAPAPSPHKYNTIFQGGGQIVQATTAGGGGGSLSNSTNTTVAGAGGVNLMAYVGSASSGCNAAGGLSGTTPPTAPTGTAIVPIIGGTLQQQPTTGGGSITNAASVAPQNVQSVTSTVTAASIAVPQVPQNFTSRDHRGDVHHRERTISTGSVASNASLPTAVTAAADTVSTTIVASQQQQPQQHRMISQQIISQQPSGATTIVPSTALVATIAPQQQQQQQQHIQPQQQSQTAGGGGAGEAGTGTPQHQIVVSGNVVVPAVAPTGAGTANQPVEFNHAITYVNKIKNRFLLQPEKYKRFLEILHTYQKEQKTHKETAQSGNSVNAKQLTEAEVYTQVAKLFDNQEDLLREFGQFLPDATSYHNQAVSASGGGGAFHGAGKNHSLSSGHDAQQQQQHVQHSHQQQLNSASIGGAVATGGGGGSVSGTIVHGSKKMSNSAGNVGGGTITNVSLKGYNSLQTNLMRLQQDRDYSMANVEGKDYAVVSPSIGGTPLGGGGGAVTGRGNSLAAGGGGGAIMSEKDRNQIVASAGGGAGNMNQKYINNASMVASMGGAMTGSLTGGATLPQGLSGSGGMGGPLITNMSSGGTAGVKRSPSYSSQLITIGGGGSGVPGNMATSRDHRGVVVGDGGVGGPPSAKRHKPICRDVSLAEASKYGTLNDYAFFDKVRKALRSPDVYENFLRCLTLFNQEIVSKSELQTLIAPFLSRYPDLLKWFQDFLGPPGGPASSECIPLSAAAAAAQRQERSQNELATDIDLSTCKRLGASYCALPKSHENVKCSGRTSLCRDVLNDTWVSFPTWSEDSTFVTSRKTQYEEFIYRCEDERFELDVVIETNSATIRVLEGVQKKLTRMSQDEISRFRLDDCLGGTSPTIHQRALRRIYGDKAADIIQGLKKNPSVAVPVVLRRMKAKEEEWREAQKSFNKQWREQNEKYYLKSLDHQGINFKQTDIKALRSKSLFNEIETLFDERHEQNEDPSASTMQGSGPHMTIPYKDKTILEDAANLLIHHVKRQTGIQKQEKARIKHMLRQFVPDLFFAPRQQLSEDEREEDDKDMDVDQDEDDCSGSKSSSNPKRVTGSGSSSSNAPSSGGGANNTNDGVVELSIMKEEAGDNNATGAEDVTTSKKGSQEGSQSSTAAGSGTPAASTVTSSSSSATGTSSSGALSTKQSNSSEDTSSRNATGSTGTSPAEGDTGSKLPIKAEIKDENEATSPPASTQDPAAGQQPMSPPLPPHASGKHIEEAYTLFFANNNWYLFLRLHAILCERLRTIYERAQIIAAEERAYESTRNNSTATALRLKPKSEIRIEEYYNTFLEMLKNLLDGNMESSSYEDTLREMFGIHAYIAFTLDRVVQNAVRQLQHCVTERGALECVELFQTEHRKGSVGGLCRTANRRIATELAYQRKAEAALQDENCYKIYIYKIDCRVTIELLDTESEDTTNNFINSQAYSSYVDRISNPAAAGTGSDSGGGGSGVGGNGGAGAGSGGSNNGSGAGGGGGAVASGSSSIGDNTGSEATGNSVMVHLDNNTRSNHNVNALTTSHGKCNIGGGDDDRTGGEAAVKVEKPDDELHQGHAVTNRPLFLARNVQIFKNRSHKRSLTINGKKMANASWPVISSDSDDTAEDTDRTVSASSRTTGPTEKSKLSRNYREDGDNGAATSSSIEEDSKSVNENDSATDVKKEAKHISPDKSTSSITTGSPTINTLGGGSAVGENMEKSTGNIPNNNNNNNSVLDTTVGSKKADNPSCLGSSKKSSTPERLSSSMNGCHNLLIDDTEQLKMDNHFRSSKVRNKPFNLYRLGSLRQASKTHPKVTKRMHQKFKKFVDQWLDRNVTSLQQDSCNDWLVGKQQNLMQNLTTTVVVQNNDLNRTPYVPYKRYKVDKAEFM